MNLKSTLLTAALMASTALITAQVVSQQETSHKGHKHAEQEKHAQHQEIPEWMKYTVPGEQHRHLDPFVGKWTYTIQMWEHPESEPMESTGKVEYKWILDGHFVLGHWTGSYMDMPFEGHDIIGYDNFRREHLSMWIDNMSTAITTSAGSYDEATKTFTHRGKHDDVMTGQKNKPFKTVTRIDGDTFTMDWLTPGEDGGMFKGMQLVATRVK